jgi:hypothetical protein
VPLKLTLIWLCVVALALPASACPDGAWASVGTAKRAKRFLGAPPAGQLVSLAKDRKTISVEAFLKRKSLRFMNWNVENYYVESPEGGPKRPPFDKSQKTKTEEEMAQVIRQIRTYKPDFVTVQEMQDLYAFKDLSNRLNRAAPKDLTDDYVPLLIEGNDGRGIDVGVLVRADLPLDYHYYSHKNEPMNDPRFPGAKKAFLRDTPALVVTVKGTDEPLFVLMLGHNKSKLGSPTDPTGAIRREVEANAAANVEQYYEALYPGVPILYGADFNGAAHSAPEYAALRERAKMKDAFDVVSDPKKRLDPDDPKRLSYTYFPPGGEVEYSQLDGILVNRAMAPFVKDAFVAEAVDSKGKVIPRPTTKQEKEARGSDHLPSVADMDLQGVLKARGLKP